MATGYFVQGAFAGVKLPRHGLETAGAQPRHGALLVVPAGALKGGRLAVVVAAAAAAPGGSHDIAASAERKPAAVSFLAGCFTRYGLISTRAPPRHGNTLALGIPTAFLASKTKNRRLAVVVAAAGAVPGGSDDGSVPPNREAAVSAFRLEMEIFKVSQRPIAFVANPTLTSPLLDAAFRTAKKCTPMIEYLLAKEDVHPDVVKEMGVAGKAFIVLEEQAREGYMRADALVNCIDGMKLVRRTFFKDGKFNMTEYPDPTVPPSNEVVDRMKFFVGLVDLFDMYVRIVYANANLKYGGFDAI